MVFHLLSLLGDPNTQGFSAPGHFYFWPISENLGTLILFHRILFQFTFLPYYSKPAVTFMRCMQFSLFVTSHQFA